MWVTNQSIPTAQWAAEAMETLNSAFNPHNIYFIGENLEEPCAPSYGTYVNSNTDPGMLETALGSPDRMDIFITDNDAGGVSGQEAGTPSTAFYIHGNCGGVPAHKTHTMVHEMGHCLGLRHIFSRELYGTCDESGSSYDKDHCGDYVSDTSYDPNQGANISTTNCVPDNPAATDIDREFAKNYMGYTDDCDCDKSFSPIQAKRMRVYLEQSEVLDDVQVPVQTGLSTPPSTPSGTIIVEYGQTLQVNNPLTMLPGAAIIVQRGGTLIVNSTITCECDFWRGIIVEGDFSNNNAHANQGKVTIRGNGQVEHALCGICAESSSVDNSGATTFNGGIVKVLGGKIVNNKVGVRLSPYGHPQASRFTVARFYVDDDFRGSEQPVLLKSNSVEMWQAVLTKFQDLRTDCPGVGSRAIGIDAYNSGFYANVSCRFENLHTGVIAGYTQGLKGSFGVGSGIFSNCLTGVMSMEASSFSVQSGTFTVAPPEACENSVGSEFKIFGTWHNGASGSFDYSDNTFNGDNESPGKHYGSLFDNTGAGMKKIVNDNTYTGLSVGNYAKGINADTTDGIIYICNVNSSNEDDFLIQGRVYRNQSFVSSFGVHRPTGNVFGGGRTFTNEGGNTIDYYFNENEFAENPNFLGSGGSLNIDPIPLDDYNPACGTGDGCPPPCDQPLVVAEWKENFWSNHAEWKERLEVLPTITDPSEREEEEQVIAGLRLGMNADVSRILRQYELDTVDVLADSVTTWLENAEYFPADVRLAKHHFFAGNFALFDQVWERIPVRFELTEDEEVDYGDLDSLFNLLRPHLETDLRLENLPGSLDTSLVSIAETCSAAAPVASVVLWQRGIWVLADCADTSGTQARMPSTTTAHADQSQPSLRVAPNPVKDGTVRVEFSPTNVPCQLSILDLGGRVLRTQNIVPNASSLTLNVSGLQPGLYLLVLREGENVIARVKMSIID